jgi:hypothetical protein
MHRDGSGRSKVAPYDVGGLGYMSPGPALDHNEYDGARWHWGHVCRAVGGGAQRRICSGCVVIWAPDGKFLYLGVERAAGANPGKVRVVPLPPGEMLPKLPPSGMVARDDPNLFPGSHLIDGFEISPGPDPSVFAYVKTTVHRNLFRIPIPR